MLDIKQLGKKRNRLRRSAVYALVLAAASCAVSFNDSLVERMTSKPDYYRIVMSEVGRGHFSSTGTTTIVREEEFTQDLFLLEYKRRNARLGFPVPANFTVPEKALFQFSYEPNKMELHGILLDELQAQPFHPNIGINQPSPPLVAMLVFSRQERMIAFFCYEDADEAVVNNPPPGWVRLPGRILQDEIQHIDTTGLVSVYGSRPRGKVIPVHAYLFPFGDLKLENLHRHLDLSTDLSLFDDVLPLFFARLSDGTGYVAPRFNQKETVERLRAEAARGFYNAQASARFLIPALCLIWIVLTVLRFIGVREKYLGELRTQMRFLVAEPNMTCGPRIGFVSFFW